MVTRFGTLSSRSKGSLVDRARRLAGRARRLFDTRVWSVPIEQLGPWRRALYRTGRILYSTATGYRGKHLSFRAAALTYFSVLSIVPFLAFAFSVVKGLGGYRRLVDSTLVPYLHRTFGENPTLLHAMDAVIHFVRGTDVAGLGTFGVVVLAYSGISLLSTIE
jgi:membrane protein